MIEDLKILTDYFELRKNGYNVMLYADYVEKIHPVVKKIIDVERILRPKHLSQNACRELFLMIARNMEGNFIVDENNSDIIDLVCYYMRSDKKFNELNPEYNIKKGLLFLGSLGTGKTILLKSISHLLATFSDYEYSYNPGFKIIPSYRISANFIKHGYEYFDNPILTGENVMDDVLGIDDLGAENKINYYGTPINVVGELILRRYDKRQAQHKGLLLCTSNLNGEGLKEFYGERVHDRLVEMVNPIILTGKSRRK